MVGLIGLRTMGRERRAGESGAARAWKPRAHCEAWELSMWRLSHSSAGAGENHKTGEISLTQADWVDKIT